MVKNAVSLSKLLHSFEMTSHYEVWLFYPTLPFFLFSFFIYLHLFLFLVAEYIKSSNLTEVVLLNVTY